MKIKTILIIITVANFLLSCSSIDYLNRLADSENDFKSSSNKISLLTYNIKAIYEKEEDQINNLMSAVNDGKYDFVLFQELFDESTRNDIIEKADSNIYNTFISRVDYNSFPEFIFQDAGLFMMSRFPRVDLSNIEFGDSINNCNGAIHMILDKEYSKTNDFLANKSVLGSLFNIDNDTKLFLFTTHVQAIGTREHKEYQLSQINNFMESGIRGIFDSGIIKDDDELVVILAGDFNSNAYSQSRHTRLLEKLDYPRDLHKEYNGDKHEYTWNFRSNSYPRRFDYVFAYDSLAGFNFSKLSVNSMSVVDILDSKETSISDHRGIETSLIFEERFVNKQTIQQN
ncbi:MAG: hypothetical protein JEY94_17355 [Melioribacteraceae bacterium]|nr:hypothetical protein [Melioribacteraceae bacterium]